MKSRCLKIRKGNTAILVVDVQSKLIKAIKNHDDLISNIRKLLYAAEVLEIEVLITEQSPDKLGSTIDILKEDTIPKTFSKESFSCKNCLDLIKLLKSQNIFNVILVGIETHICVLQSALDLHSIGFNVHVIADGVKSRNDFDHEIALKRMLNSGITISTTETTIFEICKTSNRIEFKKISQLIKGTYRNIEL